MMDDMDGWEKIVQQRQVISAHHISANTLNEATVPRQTGS
jgi:hypothetical protein